MRAKFKNEIRKISGDTKDIVSVVIDTYNNDYKQVSELVTKFGTGEAACRNIFDYIIKNVAYKEDPLGVQWVKTPARLIADATGDCKSMSIFSASCLRCLGIDHFFRFVSFNEFKEATHVYVVAVLDNGSEIILDPVVRRNGYPVFNTEEKYTHKIDMRGTDIYYLSGIRNAYIGASETADAERYAVWTGDRDNITPGKLSLFSRLDLLIELAGIANNAETLARTLDDMDMITLAIRAYDHVNADRFELEKMYYIISAMVREGAVTSNIVALDWRADNLEKLTYKLIARYELDQPDGDQYHIPTLSYLTEEVLDRLTIPAVSGVFDLLSASKMESKLKEGAIYYIYTFLSESEAAKYPEVAKKRASQLKTLKWQETIDIWHNMTAVNNIVRSGIIARTGLTPEAFLEKAKTNSFKIGWIDIVLGIVSAVIALIRLLVDLFGKKNDTPTEAEINAAIADTVGDGWTNDNNSGSTGTSNTIAQAKLNSIIPFVALGAMALFLFKKK